MSNANILDAKAALEISQASRTGRRALHFELKRVYKQIEERACQGSCFANIYFAAPDMAAQVKEDLKLRGYDVSNACVFDSPENSIDVIWNPEHYHELFHHPHKWEWTYMDYERPGQKAVSRVGREVYIRETPETPARWYVVAGGQDVELPDTVDHTELEQVMAWVEANVP